MRHLISGIGFLLVLTACGKKDDTFGSGGKQDDFIPDTSDDTTTDTDGGVDSGGIDSGSTAGDTGSTGGEDSGSTGTDTGGPTIVGTGYDAGDVAYDLVGIAQTGAPFSLHALYGSDVLLIVGNMDNPNMQDMAAWMGSVSAISVAVIGRDESGVAADVADAAGWASTYGIDYVIADGGGSLVSTWAESSPPKTYVIDDDMSIYWTHFGTSSQVQVEDKLDSID